MFTGVTKLYTNLLINAARILSGKPAKWEVTTSVAEPSELNFSGNHRLHHRGAARDIDNFDIQAVLFEQADFLRKMMNLFTRANAAVSQYDFLDGMRV